MASFPAFEKRVEARKFEQSFIELGRRHGRGLAIGEVASIVNALIDTPGNGTQEYRRALRDINAKLLELLAALDTERKLEADMALCRVNRGIAEAKGEQS